MNLEDFIEIMADIEYEAPVGNKSPKVIFFDAVSGRQFVPTELYILEDGLLQIRIAPHDL